MTVFPFRPSASLHSTTLSSASRPSGSSTRSRTTGRRLSSRTRPLRPTTPSSARSSSTQRARTEEATRASVADTPSTMSNTTLLARARGAPLSILVVLSPYTDFYCRSKITFIAWVPDDASQYVSIPPSPSTSTTTGTNKFIISLA
jgi:hypothetical protein